MARKLRSPLSGINSRIIDCRACDRLVAHREHIGRVKRRAYRDEDYWARAVPSFGDENARLLILGLAPAAHGANRTGRMFTGDNSGDWLYRSLHRAGFASQASSTARDDGLVLRDAYITAAGHCAPPDNKPTREELARCNPYLIEEFDVFISRRRRPLVILALGGIGFRAALDGLRTVGVTIPSPQPRFGHLAEFSLERGIALLASYHPSRQNTQTGRLTEDMLDAVFTRSRQIISRRRGSGA